MKREFVRKGNYYVYILQCSDGTYYTGYTNDIENRIKEHNYSKRGAKYLRGKVPVRLVYAKEYHNYRNVLRAERRIKKLSHRQKQELVRIYEKAK